MKFLIGLAVFTLMAVLAWPYLYVWRLDGAVAARDVQALGRLVDIESVRQQVKAEFSRDVNDAVGGDGGQIYRWVKQVLRRFPILPLTPTSTSSGYFQLWRRGLANRQSNAPP